MRLLAAALFVLALPATSARAAESYDNCEGFIDTLPAVITTQGVWCLRADVATAIATGNAIEVATNNVTIDCNHFKLGGLGAGPGSAARAIHATNRQNLTVRNCLIRGFDVGVSYQGVVGSLVEDNVVDGSYMTGIFFDGGEDGLVRRNRVRDSGKTASGGDAYGILVTGMHDVMDNTVTGVEQSTAIGIGMSFAPGAVVQGNRIRGLAGQAESIGIFTGFSPGALVRENHVKGPGSFAIRCFTEAAMAVDNTTSGFANGLDTGGCLTSGNVEQ